MFNYHANNLGETPVTHFGLDDREEVVGLVLIARAIGVSGNAEQFALDDLHFREQ